MLDEWRPRERVHGDADEDEEGIAYEDAWYRSMKVRAERQAAADPERTAADRERPAAADPERPAGNGRGGDPGGD